MKRYAEEEKERDGELKTSFRSLEAFSVVSRRLW
jgi:hypothetical protein